jgi:hypothetical protein
MIIAVALTSFTRDDWAIDHAARACNMCTGGSLECLRDDLSPCEPDLKLALCYRDFLSDFMLFTKGTCIHKTGPLRSLIYERLHESKDISLYFHQIGGSSVHQGTKLINPSGQD